MAVPRAARRRVRHVPRRPRRAPPPYARAPGGDRPRGGGAAGAARVAASPLDRRVDVLGLRLDRSRGRRQPLRRPARVVPRTARPPPTSAPTGATRRACTARRSRSSPSRSHGSAAHRLTQRPGSSRGSPRSASWWPPSRSPGAPAGRRSPPRSSAGIRCSPSTRAVGATTTPSSARSSRLRSRSPCVAGRRSEAPPGRSRRSSSGFRSSSSGSRRSRPVRGHVRRARPGSPRPWPSVPLVATWRYGLHWLGALGPLADNAVRKTSYALPSRLEELGLPHGVALGLAFAALLAGLALLARDALGGRARGSGPPRASSSRRRPTSPSGTSPGQSRSRPRRTTTASRGPRRSRSRRTCSRRRFRSEAKDDDAVLVEHDPEPAARAERRERSPEPRRRVRLIAVARPLLVDRDPGRLSEHGEAEDAASRGEVGAERVRRADGRVRRDQRYRSSRRPWRDARRCARASPGRSRTARPSRPGAARGALRRRTSTRRRPVPRAGSPRRSAAAAVPRRARRRRTAPVARRPCSGSGSTSACACPRGG